PQMNLASTLKGLHNDTNYLDQNEETLVQPQGNKVQTEQKSKILERKFDFIYEEPAGSKTIYEITSTLFNAPQKNLSDRVPVIEEHGAHFMDTVSKEEAPTASSESAKTNVEVQRPRGMINGRRLTSV